LCWDAARGKVEERHSTIVGDSHHGGGASGREMMQASPHCAQSTASSCRPTLAQKVRAARLRGRQRGAARKKCKNRQGRAKRRRQRAGLRCRAAPPCAQGLARSCRPTLAQRERTGRRRGWRQGTARKKCKNREGRSKGGASRQACDAGPPPLPAKPSAQKQEHAGAAGEGCASQAAAAGGGAQKVSKQARAHKRRRRRKSLRCRAPPHSTQGLERSYRHVLAQWGRAARHRGRRQGATGARMQKQARGHKRRRQRAGLRCRATPTVRIA
jgi:hypothetical protein